MQIKDAYVKTGDLVPPVERISGVWFLTNSPHRKVSTFSRPGHLFHLVTHGRFKSVVGECTYDMKPGMMITYHESEKYTFEASSEGAGYYSAAFLAPQLKPLPPEKRCFKVSDEVKDAFCKYLQASFEHDVVLRDLKMWSGLFNLLGVLRKQHGFGFEIMAEHTITGLINKAVRQQKMFRPTIDELCEICKCSKSTLIRKCVNETGMSPIKYVQEIRMAEARGLLLYSLLNITEIAEYLKYPYMHGFSREFSQYFGFSPSQVR